MDSFSFLECFLFKLLNSWLISFKIVILQRFFKVCFENYLSLFFMDKMPNDVENRGTKATPLKSF